ncbi:MAG: Fe-S cluster assembly protein SufB, partial [Gemmatimonadaceae bacterium]
MSTNIEALITREYQAGFVTDIESDTIAPGLDEDVIRTIAQKKDEPEWLLDWRLKAYRRWSQMSEPHWPNVHYDPIDYQALSYWSAP